MISLFYLRRPQIGVFLGYIEFIRPGLKEQIRNLSAFLPYVGGNKRWLQRLVLETLPFSQLSELRHRCLEELFQFSSDSTASPQANAEVSSSFNQTYVNEHLSQECMQSAQHADCTAGSPPSRTDVQNSDNLPTDRVVYNNSSARQGTFPHTLHIDRRFDIDEDPVHSERIYWSRQQLPPWEGFPNPHGDQLAQEQPGEGALDRQDRNLLAQGQSNRREVQSPSWDEFLNYAPGDSSSNTFLSPSQPTPLQSPSAMAHLSTRGTGLDVDSGSLDAWQNNAISDSMMVCTDSGQDINTVDPKDLCGHIRSM